MPTWLIKILKLILILFLPLFLLLGSVRLLATDQYLAFEYGKADFPPDTYGFTQSQRLMFASANLRFVRDNQPIDALASQTLDGQAIYNPRELSHMLDVQKVFQSAWRAWIIVGIVLLAAGLLLWQAENHEALPAAIQSGGFLTSSLMLGIGLFAIIAWQGWFSSFHLVFFGPGSWLFEYSDTLIRLFPKKFWFDTALTLLGSSLAGGLLLVMLGRRWLMQLGCRQGLENLRKMIEAKPPARASGGR